jgi:hypothetical protein
MSFNSFVVPDVQYYSNATLDWIKATIQASTGYSIVDDFTASYSGTPARYLIARLSAGVSGRSADLFFGFRLLTPTTSNSYISGLIFENYRASDHFIQRPTFQQSPPSGTISQNYYGFYQSDNSISGALWIDITQDSVTLPGAYTNNFLSWQRIWYNQGSAAPTSSEVNFCPTSQGIYTGMRNGQYATYWGFYDSALPNAATSDAFPSAQLSWNSNDIGGNGFSTRAPMLAGQPNKGGGGLLQNAANIPSVLPWRDYAFPGSPDYKGDLFQQGKVPLSAIPVLHVANPSTNYPDTSVDKIGYYRGTIPSVRYANANANLVSYGDYITVDGVQWVWTGATRWVRNDA